MKRTADKIAQWSDKFKPSDWPDGVLCRMSSVLFIDGVFKLREISGVPMWPSSLAEAHVRTLGGSRHSTKSGSRLSDATDLHVKTYAQMITAMNSAEKIKAIGGIGIYFNTNTPMLHIDMRLTRLVWICTKDGKYIYRESDPVKFYIELGNQLKNIN